MKKISVLIPCFNENENIIPISASVVNVINENLSNYDYEIIFIDNASTDGTIAKLEQICAGNRRIKAILNLANFGQFNSPFYGLCQTTGDCTITLCCDFQDPVEMIPKMVQKWEEGYGIVSCIKSKSKENFLMYRMRTMYYKMLRKMSNVKMIEHFTGFGLYDKNFINLLKELHDPLPYIRGIVAEYGDGFNMIEIEYIQQKRKAGKTHNNFWTLYDAAMLSFTSYTKVGLRIATIAGFLCGFLSFLVALVYAILKIFNWDSFDAGLAPILIGVFFLGSIQLFFIGFLAEYIFNINARVINRPLVVERRRINF